MLRLPARWSCSAQANSRRPNKTLEHDLAKASGFHQAAQLHVRRPCKISILRRRRMNHESKYFTLRTNKPTKTPPHPNGVQHHSPRSNPGTTRRGTRPNPYLSIRMLNPCRVLFFVGRCNIPRVSRQYCRTFGTLGLNVEPFPAVAAMLLWRSRLGVLLMRVYFSSLVTDPNGVLHLSPGFYPGNK